MKKLILIALALPLLFSCSKNEGCNDNSAFNFSVDADFDDGSCVYTRLTFYADSSNYPATPIERIEILINESGIGSFSGATYSVLDCSAESDITLSFPMKSSTQVEWKALVFLTNGTTNTKTGTVASDLAQSCILINAL